MLIFVIVIALAVILSYVGIPFLGKTISSDAKVIMKEHWGGEDRGVFTANRFIVRVAPSCRVTFELENRTSVTLLIPIKVYNTISIGSTGMLNYSAETKKFRKFTVNETADKNELETQKTA